MTASSALTQLEESLRLCDALLTLESGYSDPPLDPDERRIVQGLRGGAIVIMVAAFERFVEDMIVERFESLATNAPYVRLLNMPVEMQLYCMSTKLDWAVRGRPHDLSDRDRSHAKRVADIVSACQALAEQQVVTDVLGELGGSPNSEHLMSLFKRVGIRDVFAWARFFFDKRWAKAEAKDFLRLKVDDIVDKRHSVAHAADTLKLSRVDLNVSAEFIRVLSQALDEGIEQWVEHLASRTASLVASPPASKLS
ncbi:MAG: HEPN domain-containing protein [Chloroflexota bacterium]